MTRAPISVSRRAFLAHAGALIVTFSLAPLHVAAQDGAAHKKLPGSLDKAPLLDAWIRVAADGSVTVFTGKAELGQGVKTALIALAAEELGVAPSRIALITADTSRTPNEGYTAGSNSMKDSGTAIQNAAAQVREILIERAAGKLGIAADRLHARDGAIVADDGRRLGFGDLVAESYATVRAQAAVEAQGPAQLRHRRYAACRGSTFRRRSPVASRTCRICACPGCCTRASCVRRATGRSCATRIARTSRRCPA